MKINLCIGALALFCACKHPDADKFSRDPGGKRSSNNDNHSSNTDRDLERALDYERELQRNRNNEDAQRKAEQQKKAIPMESKDGVKYVTIEINGIPLRFVFDTGASSICISSLEAELLIKQGTLQEEDLIGTENFQDATGKVSQGTKIRLKTVRIGDYLLENIEATIVDNPHAPLLLGQTVLEKFGSIEIDNANSQIILK
jgi:aspartyl protease family protein